MMKAPSTANSDDDYLRALLAKAAALKAPGAQKVGFEPPAAWQSRPQNNQYWSAPQPTYMAPTLLGTANPAFQNGLSPAYNMGRPQTFGNFTTATKPGQMPTSNQGYQEPMAWTEASPLPNMRADTWGWKKNQRQPQKKAQARSQAHAVAAEEAEEVETAEQIQADNMGEALLSELRQSSPAEEHPAVAKFRMMAFTDKISSMAAQAAIDGNLRQPASAEEQMKLVNGLRSHVLAAMKDQHANYVITQIRTVLPGDKIKFIVEELTGHASTVARHRFGCRIFCRIFEHFDLKDEASMNLMDEVLEDVASSDLCTHSFGSFVVRHILEHGLPEHKAAVAAAIGQDLIGIASKRKGSHVVEAVFSHCSVEDQQLLAKDLLADSPQLLSLAHTQFGRHVVVSMMSSTSAVSEQVIGVLKPLADQLSSAYGQYVQKALCSAIKSRSA